MYEATVPVGVNRWSAETMSTAPAHPLFVLNLQANERACRLRWIAVDGLGAATEGQAVGYLQPDSGWQFSGPVTASGVTVTVPAPDFSGSLYAWIDVDFTQNYQPADAASA